MYTKDTITAISTPQGSGAIALIRLSGNSCLSIIKEIFTPYNKSVTLQHKKACYGYIHKKDKIIDNVILVYFKKPHSYTGEDTIEISCHGSTFIQNKIIEIITKKNARIADPGEFTKRAFLNNKINLLQAEAVSNLIAAETEEAHKLSINQINKEHSKKFSIISDKIKNILSIIEANIDFAEDDIDLFDPVKINNEILEIINILEKIVDTYKYYQLVNQGIKVAITGPPNAGKSSLFNALCEKQRVIVDEHPGTTRDTIEETVSIKGRKVTFIDTAGIHDNSDNKIENIGIQIAKECAEKSDMNIIVFGADMNISKNHIKYFSKLSSNKNMIIVNKNDLKKNTNYSELENDLLFVSAKTKQGINAIKDKIINEFSDNNINVSESLIIATQRQKNILINTKKSLLNCIKLLNNEPKEELLAFELREALDHLSYLTGKTTDDDILNSIFGNFCIGK